MGIECKFMPRADAALWTYCESARPAGKWREPPWTCQGGALGARWREQLEIARSLLRADKGGRMKGSPITIGILGGGQLARMSAYAAFRMGLQVAIIEKTP